MPRKIETRTGIGVDASGNAVIDPTANVISLVEAAMERQDDLRAASDKFNEAAVTHSLELANLRAKHAKELRAMEANRLDAIRQVDVLAVNTAADRAAAAIEALAKTTAANAENLRTALQNTAATIATQLTQTVNAMTERISTLEKSMYAGTGKEQNKTAVWAAALVLLGLGVTVVLFLIKK